MIGEALVDFHLHTTCSDGAWEPARLFEEVRARGIEYFCISDHDNMDAYPVDADLLDRCVSGVEIDTEDNGQTVHVLAYGIKRSDGMLMNRLAEQRRNREHRAQYIIDRLNGLGIDITLEQVVSLTRVQGSIGRPHIARTLVAAQYCDNIQDAFDTYLAEGRAAYVALSRLSTDDAVNLIRQAQGLSVLAHPRRLRDQGRLDDIVRRFDGIEVVHPSADADFQRMLFDLADTRAMIATGGSDFHARPTDPGIGIPFPRSRIKRLIERLAA